MVLTLSAYVFKTVWIAYSEHMTTLTTTSAKYFLSIYCTLASEESVDTKTFSFFEFTEHRYRNEYFITSGLYKNKGECQRKCRF
jgi:hypothetical protein